MLPRLLVYNLVHSPEIVLGPCALPIPHAAAASVVVVSITEVKNTSKGTWLQKRYTMIPVKFFHWDYLTREFVLRRDVFLLFKGDVVL
eukprot:2667910-Rhodomonas_salina.1